MTRHLNHLIWILPALTGIVGYGLGHRIPAAAAQPPPTAIPEVRDLRSKNARVALASVPDQLKTERERHAQRLATLTPVEIRLRLLALTAPKGPDVDIFQRLSFWEERNDLIEALAHQEGAEAATWMQDQLPHLRHLYMEAWAQLDPEAALDFVVHSQRPTPCSMQTLEEVLDMRARSGAAALREAIDEIPWYLFDPSNEHDAEMPGMVPGSDMVIDPSEMPAEAADGDEARNRMWLESGAARLIAERGIPVPEALSQWFEVDPQRALSEWIDWPRRPEVSASDDLLHMLGGHLASAEGIEALRDSFRQTAPATAAALKQTLQQLATDPDSQHPEIRQFTGEDFSAPLPPDGE
jgi:hypothetical protein